MRIEISAGGVVVQRSGGTWYVLLMKDMKGIWTFPKGIIEKGEIPQAAAQREIREEVGVKNLTYLADLSSVEYTFHRNGLIKKTVHYFLLQSSKTEILKPQKEEGISQAQWFSLEDALANVGYRKTNKPLLNNVILSLRANRSNL